MPRTKLTHIKTKIRATLSDEELMMAWSGARALTKSEIPAAVSYADTGVLYDTKGNEIGRAITMVWLNIKGVPLLTRTQKGPEAFTVEDVQTLVNGIADQYRKEFEQAQADSAKAVH